MKIYKTTRVLILLIVIASNVSCDQISKIAVRKTVDYNERISLIGNHLTLTKVENPGAFLSLGDQLPEPVRLLLLVILPLLALGIVFLLMLKKAKRTWIAPVGIAFIAGGGIGNLYDRVVYGSVTDFLHIDLGIVQTGIFNMADVSIMVGISLITIGWLMDRNVLKIPNPT